MTSCIFFPSSSLIPCICIIRSNSARSATSISAITVQYCSAQKSVMMRICGTLYFVPIAFMVLNFSTSGRTLPGLQFMISRTTNMAVSD